MNKMYLNIAKVAEKELKMLKKTSFISEHVALVLIGERKMSTALIKCTKSFKFKGLEYERASLVHHCTATKQGVFFNQHFKS